MASSSCTGPIHKCEALTPDDNLYVANGRDVEVYAPGATKLLYRINERKYGAAVLAIGSQ